MYTQNVYYFVYIKRSSNMSYDSFKIKKLREARERLGYRKYTEKMHMRRMSQLINSFEKGRCKNMGCPAGKKFTSYLGDNIQLMWPGSTRKEICQVCRKSVGIEKGKVNHNMYGHSKYCPCNVLGKEEAIAKAKEAIGDYYGKT